MTQLDCFKAYDIRGKVPDQLDTDIAFRIGRAYAEELSPRKVVVGRDIREESPQLADAVAEGLMAGGADVLDIGLCGTEEVYFHAFHGQVDGVDGGIMITASHNPKGYNGMKLVREGARPISGDSGLDAIRERAEALAGAEAASGARGNRQYATDKTAYIDHLLGYIEPERLAPLKIVANAGNGSAGKVVRLLDERLPIEFVHVHSEPDGSFPNGVPNPLLPENRASTADAVREHGADLGIAWDGDFDRCFFFDENGEFIEGYYIVGLLAEALLAAHPGQKIVHDPRLIWNTVDTVERVGGIPVESKTGHAFIKERMRKENAIYGGEMSAHHYFRDFAYCDSGMIPWLMILELLSRRGQPLSALVGDRVAAYPCSGEINYRVADVDDSVRAVQSYFDSVGDQAVTDWTDGLSMEFADWRFNLRASNTEPLLRLNVESRGDRDLVGQRVAEIERLLSPMPG